MQRCSVESRCSECQRTCDRILAEMGPIDILINNVGNREASMSIEAEPLETWR